MLKEYEVNVRETLETKVTMRAVSREEAERLAEQKWKNGDYILDSDCFTGVEFTARKLPERERDGGR